MTMYPEDVSDVVLHQLLGWRSMHSQGRALFSLMIRHLGDDINTYSLREAEFMCNSIVAFNFGDGHLQRREVDRRHSASLQFRTR